MSWLKSEKPKITTEIGDQLDIPKHLWTACPGCGKMLHHKEVAEYGKTCHKCGHHMMMTPIERFELLFDECKYEVLDDPKMNDDPLKFVDLKPYADRLVETRKKLGVQDVIKSAVGKLNGAEACISVFDFRFMGGSMGVAVGEALVKGMEESIKRNIPFVVVPASGGARMQESILSLMQMVRTTVMVNKLGEKNIPYIVVFTDPTYGGVPASFAMIGDVHISESKARIGFAGRRVIEETNREKLPEEFQTAEFLKEKGMIDIVVHRKDLKSTLSNVIYLLTLNKKKK